MLFEEGLEAAFRRHQLLAGATQAAVGRWSKGGALSFNIPEPAERSPTVTTILLEEPHLGRLLDWVWKVCNVSLGIGLGPLSGHAFRIAHMGHVNAPMILGTLGAIETGLAALDIPHAKGGVSAAIDYLGARFEGVTGFTENVKPAIVVQDDPKFQGTRYAAFLRGISGCCLSGVFRSSSTAPDIAGTAAETLQGPCGPEEQPLGSVAGRQGRSAQHSDQLAVAYLFSMDRRRAG